MRIDPLSLLSFFVSSILLGILSGPVYDCMRLHRVMLGYSYTHPEHNATIPRRRKVVIGILTGLQDFLYCITAAVAICILNYCANDGVFRGFELVGFIVGFVLYYYTLGKLVMRLSEAIIAWLYRFIRKTVTLIITPFRRLYRLLKQLCHRLAFCVYSTLYKHIEQQRLQRLAEQGFMHTDRRKTMRLNK